MKRILSLLVAGMLIAPGAGRAALVTAGELIVDLRNTDLSAASSSWINHATGSGAVGDFATVGGGNANVVVGKSDGSRAANALFVDSTSANGMLSALDTPSALEGNSPRSAEAWVWVEALGTQSPLGWGSTSPNGSYNEYRFSDSSGNGMWSGWYIDSGWELNAADHAGKWVHVAWTYDGATMTGYINGSFVNSKDLSGEGNHPLTTASSLIAVGGGINGSADIREDFSGSIADARVHTGVLSAADVLHNYNEGMFTSGSLPPSISGLTDRLAVFGEDVLLNPSISGSEPITYQWSVNGGDLAGETNATLSLENVQVGEHGKVYTLVASNAVESATAGMTLTVSSHAEPNGFCMVGGTVTGGEGGPVVTVDNGTDFITQIGLSGPRVVQVSGAITIGQIATSANKTIVGLGTDAALLGRLRVDNGTTNVIIRNLRVTHPGEDGITIRDDNTSHVWVDHVTFFDCGDGACDISAGADYVTVSWCKFVYPTQREHKFTMIADGPKDDGPRTAHITLHHNWWSSGSDQRMAATSDALVHYYNNYYDCAGNSYCSNARDDAQLLIENSYYSGVDDPVGISSGTTGKIKTSGNLYPGCTGGIHSGTDTVFVPSYAYALDATADVPGLVQAGAGAPGPDTVPIPSKVWNGAGANNNLSTSGSWALNEAPREFDSLSFAGSTRLAPDNNFSSGTEFQTIGFSDTAGAFTLDGNRLNIGIGVTSDSAAVQTINADLDFAYASDHFAMDRAFHVSAENGALVINGNLTGSAPGYNKSYAIAKTGPGLLTLTGANSIHGTFHFDGGLVRFNNLGNLGTTALEFNGGGLQWAAGNTADPSGVPLTIRSGGATLDSGANDIVLASSIGSFGAGGLTKTGSGSITLNGGNYYSGPTEIREGTLALGASGALPTSPRITLTNNAVLNVTGRSDGTLTLGNGKSLIGNGTVSGSLTAGNGSTVAPGFSLGTLVVSDALIFQSGSECVMELDTSLEGSNDLFSGMSAVTYGGDLEVLNLGPALVAGDSFQLFDAASYGREFNGLALPSLDSGLAWTNTLAINGALSVVAVAPPVDPTPTNLVFSVEGGTNLTLSWPESHIGWTLEAQTNHLGTDWFAVPGSAATNQMTLPIFPAATNAFFRMRYP